MGCNSAPSWTTCTLYAGCVPDLCTMWAGHLVRSGGMGSAQGLRQGSGPGDGYCLGLVLQGPGKWPAWGMDGKQGEC